MSNYILYYVHIKIKYQISFCSTVTLSFIVIVSTFLFLADFVRWRSFPWKLGWQSWTIRKLSIRWKSRASVAPRTALSGGHPEAQLPFQMNDNNAAAFNRNARPASLARSGKQSWNSFSRRAHDEELRHDGTNDRPDDRVGKRRGGNLLDKEHPRVTPFQSSRSLCLSLFSLSNGLARSLSFNACISNSLSSRSRRSPPAFIWNAHSRSEILAHLWNCV